MRREKETKLLRMSLRQAAKERKSALVVYILLRALVIVSLVLQIFNRNYENVFLCSLTLIFFTIPMFLEQKLRIEIPDVLEILIYLFIYAAAILGEMNSFYVRFPFWDTMLHTINGFLAAAIGLSLVGLLNQSEKILFKLSPFFLAITAFCFSMTIGVLWEFFEFFMDQVFHTDMQKDFVVNNIYTVALDATHTNRVIAIPHITSVTINGEDLGLGGYLDIGLIDTMKDLIVNFIGATTFSFFGYYYFKRKEKGKFLNSFLLYSVADRKGEEQGKTEQ